MNNLMRRDQSYDWPFFSDIFDVDRFFGTPYFNNSQRSPAVNIQENDKEYDIDVFAPGFKKEDFSVEVDNDMLHIKAENHGETTDKEKKNFTRKEYHYSSFTRSFRLPDDVKDDKIGARYEDGVLKLTVPKSEGANEKATKQIKIS